MRLGFRSRQRRLTSHSLNDRVNEILNTLIRKQGKTIYSTKVVTFVEL